MEPKRKLIGTGAVSKIYLEDGIAYKTFNEKYPIEWVEYEVKVHNIIKDHTTLEIPSYEFMDVSKEISMDYIDGKTLGERMRQDKYKDALSDLIDLQLSIFEYTDLPLKNIHEDIKVTIKNSNMDSDMKMKATTLLDKIEIKNNLCHLDLHFLNIMFADGKYYIIDWINAGIGNPVFDIARTYIIMKQYTPRLANKYLKEIVSRGNFTTKEISSAILLMAILRLLENDTTEFKDGLLAIIHGDVKLPLK